MHGHKSIIKISLPAVARQRLEGGGGGAGMLVATVGD